MQARLLPRPGVPVLTVSQVNQLIRATLEEAWPDCWVAGEISGMRVPVSGHAYFTLKDARSQLACVLFRNTARTLPFTPTEGMQVIVRGRISIYEARGDLQLYVDTIEPQGAGAQQLALEQLKQRLAGEGLFDEGRKRPLPFLPRAIGIATALRGAAIHDMLTVLHSRWPGVPVVVRPMRVQGSDAAPDIVAALEDLQSVTEVEVIIVGRGGGSVEDLWVFNDETVARAIHAARVPVVSAIGHEVDFTIADLVADRRAPTPTAAAALVVPERRQLAQQRQQLETALTRAMTRRIDHERQRLTTQARQLRDPRRVLQALQQRIDEHSDRALRALRARLRLWEQRLASGVGRLDALSPLAVLQRGYGIARRQDGTVARDATRLQAGELLDLLLANGTARVRVEPSAGSLVPQQEES